MESGNQTWSSSPYFEANEKEAEKTNPMTWSVSQEPD